MDNLFCSNCGSKIEPGQEFCVECGARIEAIPQAGATMGSSYESGSSAGGKKGIDGKIIGIIAAAAAVVIIAVIAVVTLSGGYKRVISSQVSLVNSKTTKTADYGKFMPYSALTANYYKAYNKLLEEINEKDSGEYEENFMDAVDDEYENFEDDYGKNWKIKSEIKKTKKCGKNKTSDLDDSWENWVDSIQDDLKYKKKMYDDVDDDYFDAVEKEIDKLEKMKVTKAYEVKVKYTIKGKEDDDSETAEIYIVKIGGKWVSASSAQNLFYYF